MSAMKSKLPALLLSLVVAMGLWLYVVTSVSPESDQIYSGIPVVFENETSLLDRELMLVSGENATVSVRLYGKRANLNRLNASNIIVTVDLRAVTEPGKYELEYKVSYPSGITNVSLDKRVTPTVSVEAVRFEEKGEAGVSGKAGGRPDSGPGAGGAQRVDRPCLRGQG